MLNYESQKMHPASTDPFNNISFAALFLLLWNLVIHNKAAFALMLDIFCYNIHQNIMKNMIHIEQYNDYICISILL